ncbi:hypothetical protein [Rhodoferax antarcticus]|uniref:hypothetical protein n=1 Tax=Rhodoferax antarcticus TaxID=81479 RepID=UPI000AB905B4|nr:hypothetical protein [Rhodoferax antarcticus]
MKHLKKRVSIAVCVMVLITPSAHAQFEMIRDASKAFSDFVREAIESTKLPQTKPGTQPRPQPFKPIIGNWYDNHAVITSVAQDSEYEQYNYSWTGQIVGRVNEIGEYIFRADNGCQITGVSSPYASSTMWSIFTQTKNCPFEHLNHRMTGRIYKEGNVLILQLKDPPMAMGRNLAYTMQAVMQSY